MNITDLKQILWWLSGGLLICTGVIGGLLVFRPPRNLAYEWSKWGERRMREAIQVDQETRRANLEFRRDYAATYALKIDGRAPPPPRRPRRRPGR